MPPLKKQIPFFRRKKLSDKTLFLFMSQLATLVNAGLPLLEGLHILAEQAPEALLQRTIEHLMDSIQSGSSLSEALATHPQVFNTFTITMVRAGEAGGILGIALQRLADIQEKLQKIKNKIFSILVYPTIVLIVTSLIVVFLLAFIVPKFETTFREMLPGKSLPFLTEAIISISRNAKDYLSFITLGVFFLLVTWKFFLKTEQGKIIIDTIKLKLPLFGNLFQKSAITLFTQTLGTLIIHGVPILEALKIAQDTSGNKVMTEAISKIHHSLKEGDSMITPIKATDLFPPLVISMIAVGEETGQLSEMLLSVASIYENEVNEQTTRLLSLLEPLLILFLALIVGTIVIALFLPLITMMSEMGLENG